VPQGSGGIAAGEGSIGGGRGAEQLRLPLRVKAIRNPHIPRRLGHP
jgi:hypothetical protein